MIASRTSRPSPHDVVEPDAAPIVGEKLARGRRIAKISQQPDQFSGPIRETRRAQTIDPLDLGTEHAAACGLLGVGDAHPRREPAVATMPAPVVLVGQALGRHSRRDDDVADASLGGGLDHTEDLVP